MGMIEQEAVRASGPEQAATTAAPTTRTELREAAVSKWRSDMLACVVSPSTWMSLGACYILMMVALVFGAATATDWAWLAIAGMAVLTVASWSLLIRMRRRDDSFRTLATLTPLLDVSVARGEASILRAQFGALLATMSNPNAGRERHVQALDALMEAARPLMRRGGVTEETAAVAGYPAWPEIDRTTMPGEDQDRLSVHLHRIEASILRLDRTLEQEGVVMEESIARMAGEIVPPARSVRAVMTGQ